MNDKNLLIINSGSKTIKFEVFNSTLKSLLKGEIDNKNGIKDLKITTNEVENAKQIDESISSVDAIVQEINAFSISKIGYRIVHGGEKFVQPLRLDEVSIAELEKISNLAPLHNPPALELIKKFREKFENIPMYAVFDTAFHQSLKPKRFLYGLPYEFYTDYGVRRYGFHGISHKYVSGVMKTLEPQANKIISCHLGSGSSITAIMDSLSFDTSMGMTPMEGLMMTTRPGDVDDGAIDYLQKQTGMTDKQILTIENEKSGLLGISGISFDMRTLLEAEKTGNKRAHLAIEMYIYKVVKYIGSYIAGMNGVNGLIFTGGIGAGSDVIRKRICSNLSFAGIYISNDSNDGKINVIQNLKISSLHSKPIWIIPTDEEYQIASEVINLNND
jgi:acetate kinase